MNSTWRNTLTEGKGGYGSRGVGNGRLLLLLLLSPRPVSLDGRWAFGGHQQLASASSFQRLGCSIQNVTSATGQHSPTSKLKKDWRGISDLQPVSGAKNTAASICR